MRCLFQSSSLVCGFYSVITLLAVLTLPAAAAITTSGDVQPDDPATWNSSTDGYIGRDADGTMSITEGDGVVCRQGYVGYSSSVVGLVSVVDSGSTWTTDWDLNIGYYGQGTLSITNGGTVTSNDDSFIGHKEGASGEVTVDSQGSEWTIDGRLDVGYNGQGMLNITNDGAVTSNWGCIGGMWGTGTVLVDGQGSSWTIVRELYVGERGQGTMDITNGGNVSCESGIIGYWSPGTGEVSVDGEGSSWNCRGSLYVGKFGQGTLDISNGGSVGCWWGYISGESGSTGEVSVDGTGSSWNCDYHLSVGYYGQGTLEISNGGSISCEGAISVGRYGQGTLNISSGGNSSTWEGYIGSESGSMGEVSVDGEDSSWNCIYNLYVGFNGQGTLEITNGGNVSCEWAHIGMYPGSTGEVSVDGEGSSWYCSGELYVGYDGQGTLNISNGGNVEAGEILQVGSDGTLNIDSTSSASVGGSILFEQDSTMTAQQGAEIHMIAADFQNESTNAANLAGLSNLALIFEGGSEDVDEFEVAGKDEGAVASAFSVDNFLIGTLQLGGTGAGGIMLIDAFDNQPGWDGSEALYVSNLILNAGATIDLNDLHLYYLNGGSPKQFFNGDSNLDGLVDDSDLNIVLSDWGKTVPPGNPRADLSGDLFVDDADLNILLSDWGRGTPPAYGQSIPEPATLVLLLAGLGFGGIRRRKR